MHITYPHIISSLKIDRSVSNVKSFDMKGPKSTINSAKITTMVPSLKQEFYFKYSTNGVPTDNNKGLSLLMLKF